MLTHHRLSIRKSINCYSPLCYTSTTFLNSRQNVFRIFLSNKNISRYFYDTSKIFHSYNSSQIQAPFTFCVLEVCRKFRVQYTSRVRLWRRRQFPVTNVKMLLPDSDALPLHYRRVKMNNFSRAEKIVNKM